MAKIIQYQQQTDPSLRGVPLPLADSNPNVGSLSVQRGLGALAEASSNAGQGYAVYEDAKARAWAAPVLSGARVQWTQHFMERQQTAQDGAEGFTPSLLKDYDEYMDKTIDSAPSDSARQFVEDRLLAFREELAGKALSFEAEAGVAHRDKQLKDGADAAATLMNTDPGQWQPALSEQLALIDSAATLPQKRDAARQYAINTISGAAVWSEIQRSPTGFLHSIGFYGEPSGGRHPRTRASSGDLTGRTGNDAFDILPFDERVKYFNEAIRLKNQIETDADRAANSRATRSNPATYKHLQELEIHDPEAARDYALTAYSKGLLSDAHFAEALGPFRDLARQVPASEYKRSRDFIKDSLDPGPLVQDPVGRGRMAEAVDTFDRWFTSGKWDDEAVMKRGREIVKQYQFINLRDTVAGLPQPRNGQIRRNTSDAKGMLSDIAASGRATQDLYAKGALNKQEYDAEMDNLNRWRKAATGAQ